MIRVTGRGLVADAQAAHYSVAGQAFVCQNAMRGMDAYATGLATRRFTSLLTKFVERPEMTKENASLRYLGRAYFSGGFREVQFWESGSRGQINIDGEPTCSIDFEDCHIHVLNEEPLGTGLNFEVVTGPALVLLLTKQQIYCMHAGAVDTPVGRIGIIAESGAGKSTLSANVDTRWSQVSDDIMPLSIDQNEQQIIVLPDFPQLKMPNHIVADGPKPKLALDYLLRLDPEHSNNIDFSVLARTQALLQVVRHTVAAKLFDINTLQSHAEFAKAVTMLVPVVQVSYPRDLKKLNDIRGSIVDYLGSL